MFFIELVTWSAMAGGLAARMVRATVTVSSVAGGIPETHNNTILNQQAPGYKLFCRIRPVYCIENCKKSFF